MNWLLKPWNLIYTIAEVYCGPGGIAVGARNSSVISRNQTFSFEHKWATDYHSDTSSPVGTQRCAATAGVIDGNDDDKEGLIKFARGYDYFDYDGDCF